MSLSLSLLELGSYVSSVPRPFSGPCRLQGLCHCPGPSELCFSFLKGPGSTGWGYASFVAGPVGMVPVLRVRVGRPSLGEGSLAPARERCGASGSRSEIEGLTELEPPLFLWGAAVSQDPSGV